jgi:hypothetical protein
LRSGHARHLQQAVVGACPGSVVQRLVSRIVSGPGRLDVVVLVCHGCGPFHGVQRVGEGCLRTTTTSRHAWRIWRIHHRSQRARGWRMCSWPSTLRTAHSPPKDAVGGEHFQGLARHLSGRCVGVVVREPQIVRANGAA